MALVFDTLRTRSIVGMIETIESMDVPKTLYYRQDPRGSLPEISVDFEKPENEKLCGQKRAIPLIDQIPITSTVSESGKWAKSAKDEFAVSNWASRLIC